MVHRHRDESYLTGIVIMINCKHHAINPSGQLIIQERTYLESS